MLQMLICNWQNMLSTSLGQPTCAWCKMNSDQQIKVFSLNGPNHSNLVHYYQHCQLILIFSPWCCHPIIKLVGLSVCNCACCQPEPAGSTENSRIIFFLSNISKVFCFWKVWWYQLSPSFFLPKWWPKGTDFWKRTVGMNSLLSLTS